MDMLLKEGGKGVGLIRWALDITDTLDNILIELSFLLDMKIFSE